MYKRVLLWSVSIVVGLLVLTQTPLIYTLFSLFVLGMIPGTTVAIPAWVLLITYPLLFAGAVWWLSTQTFLIGAAPVVAAKPLKKVTAKKKRGATAVRKTASAKRSARATV